jgi:hypothetical protein
MTITTGLRACAAGLAMFVAGCSPSVESLDCDDIARQLADEPQREGAQVSNFENLREESRNENEARCTGRATINNEASDVYLRAYQAGEGNVLLEWRNQPFDPAAAPAETTE